MISATHLCISHALYMVRKLKCFYLLDFTYLLFYCWHEDLFLLLRHPIPPVLPSLSLPFFSFFMIFFLLRIIFINFSSWKTCVQRVRKLKNLNVTPSRAALTSYPVNAKDSVVTYNTCDKQSISCKIFQPYLALTVSSLVLHSTHNHNYMTKKTRTTQKKKFETKQKEWTLNTHIYRAHGAYILCKRNHQLRIRNSAFLFALLCHEIANVCTFLYLSPASNS